MPRVIALLALAGSVAIAGAQPAPETVNRRGFSMGLDPLTYAALTSDGITGGRTVGGFGLQGRFGWGFSDRVALVMEVAVSNLRVADTAAYLLDHGDVLLRVTPFARRGPGGVWAPFVHVGLGFRGVDAEDASPTGTRIYHFEGDEVTLGGGAELYVTRELSVFFGASWSMGDFTDERIGNVTFHGRKVAGESVRAAAGLTWHAGRRRGP